MRNDYPVYEKWQKTTMYLLELCGKYPRNVRFNLCDRITNLSLDVLEEIVEAIYVKRKKAVLRRSNMNLEKIRTLIHISVLKKYISVNQYDFVTSEINATGRMVGGWLKSCGE